MGLEAIKLELIEWLTKLDNQETINYLKVVKDSASEEADWWDNLPQYHQNGIKKGLKDIEDGRIVSHEDVKNQYGL